MKSSRRNNIQRIPTCLIDSLRLSDIALVSDRRCQFSHKRHQSFIRRSEAAGAERFTHLIFASKEQRS
jgi:hypothetical protein